MNYYTYRGVFLLFCAQLPISYKYTKIGQNKKRIATPSKDNNPLLYKFGIYYKPNSALI